MGPKNETERRLSESPIFADIPEEKLFEVARLAENRVVPAHTIIFQQGEPAESFFIINRGKVRVFKKGEEGLETDLAHLGPGESFGEMALVTEKPRSANVEALEETHLIVLPKDQFDRILRDYPHISSHFIKLLSSWILRDDRRLERETERQFRALRLSWFDLLVIFGLSILFGVSFNLSNPNGVRLIPKAWTAEAVSKVPISVAVAKHAEKRTLFVDARPANFYDQRRIKDAVNLPLALFDIMYMMQFNKIPKTKEIIVYGKTISRLYDEEVVRKLLLRGHKNTRVLQGGFPTWERQGYPVAP